MPRMMWAFLVAIGIDAQRPFVQNATFSTPVMSPTVVGNSQEILDYLQCRARSGIATVDAELAPMCLTNLGRQ